DRRSWSYQTPGKLPYNCDLRPYAHLLPAAHFTVSPIAVGQSHGPDGDPRHRTWSTQRHGATRRSYHRSDALYLLHKFSTCSRTADPSALHPSRLDTTPDGHQRHS